jgi:hypothetical protein
MSVGNYNSVAISVGNKKKNNSAGISVGKIKVITDGYSVGKRHDNSDGISVGDWATAVNFVNDTTIPTDKFSL